MTTRLSSKDKFKVWFVVILVFILCIAMGLVTQKLLGSQLKDTDGNLQCRATTGSDTHVVEEGFSLTGRFFFQGEPDDTPVKVKGAWSMIDGPGLVFITDAYALTTKAAVVVPGTYILRLTVTNGKSIGSCSTKFTVVSKSKSKA